MEQTENLGGHVPPVPPPPPPPRFLRLFCEDSYLEQSLCLLVTLMTWESKGILQFMFDSFLESEREATL